MTGLFDVRPEDRRSTAAAFVTLFGMMAAHALLETARDALFLASLPARDLPWAYLAIAGFAFFAARINRHCSEVLPARRLLSSSLVMVGLVTTGMWFLTGALGDAGFFIFYVWTGLAATFVIVQFWLLLGDTFTVSQAKRVYALIGAGGLLGATGGALLAGLLLTVIAPTHLVLVGAAVFALTAVAPLWIRGDANRDVAPRSARKPSNFIDDDDPRWGGFALLRGHRYLRRLALIVILSTITVTLIDFLFKSVVKAELDPSELGTFFAQYYAGLNAASLVVQLALASWLLRSAGVNRTLQIMPALLIAAAGSFAVLPGLAAAMVVKGIDGSLRHSLHRTSAELLYVPLSAGLRRRFKSFIDTVGQRGGQALASLAILVAVALGVDVLHLAIAVGLLALAWVLTIVGLRRHYLELFRSQLSQGSLDLRAELPELDLHQLEALMSALNSEDDTQVVTALDLFAEHGRINLIPALILYHPSRHVKLRALELFAEARRRDFLSIALRLMYGDDNEVRAAALRAKSAVDPEELRLREFLVDDSARVRATALVAIITSGIAGPHEAEAGLRKVLVEGTLSAKRALAQAIRYQPDERLSWVLIELGKESDPILLREVAHAIANQPHLKFMTSLLRMLPLRRVRPAARAAVLTIGPVALDFLDGALSDDSLPVATRRHIPRTISKFGSAKAARILLDHLAAERDGMTRFKILRGLGRMTANDPRISLNRKALHQAVDGTLRRIVTMLQWRLAVEQSVAARAERQTKGSELLISLLREKERNACERLFRLFGLLHPKEKFQNIYTALHSAEAKARSSSRELLANVLEPRFRDVTLALVDEVSDARRLRGVSDYFEPPQLEYSELLRSMLSDGSEAVRSIAVYHIAELGLAELRPELELAQPHSHGYTREVLDRALRLLTEPRLEMLGAD